MSVLGQLLTKPLAVMADLGRWFLGLSLAGRVAVAVAVFQVFLVVLALSVILLAGGIPIFQAWWTPGKFTSLLFLMMVVPGLVFLAARLWLHHDVARWPDIDNAWTAARGELDRQAIDIRTTPLFLVVGLDGRDEEQTFMNAAPGGLLVKWSPSGSAPLHVYASADAMFVSLSGVGSTCAILNGAEQAGGPHAAPAAEPASDAWRGGIASRYRLDDVTEHAAADRLRTLCEWLQTARQPVAALNGIIVVVPLGDDDSAAAATLGAAVNADLRIILSTIGLRAPVVIAWRGLERLPGFRDLLAAFPAPQQQAALGTPWPAGLAVTLPAAFDLAISTCGALIDRVSDHLLLPQSLQQPAVNRSLIELMCRLRQAGGSAMTALLERLVALADPICGPPPIAGSYFVAASTGGGPDCFVRGLLERVVAAQGELEWTRQRLAQDRNCQFVGRFLVALDALLLTGVVGVIWWRLTH